MKKTNIKMYLSHFALAAALTAFFMPMVSCNDLEDDDHYCNSDTRIVNPELKIVKSTSQEYVASRQDLASMNQLFASHGIYDEMARKGQLCTILAVANDNYYDPQGEPEDIDFMIRSHVSDVSISPANIKNGDRLMMWNGKYTNITIEEEPARSGELVGKVKFNNGVVKEVIQTSNGYIYVISDMIETPTSLSDFINELEDDYSVFRDLVLSSGGKEFDKANSTPIGISNDGNTLYDSVFIYTNAHFDDVNFDLNSESLTATLLLPSNEVINEAVNEAKRKLQSWGLERPDSVLREWVRDVCFFNKRLTYDDLTTVAGENEDPASRDVKSIFSKQWRPGKHIVSAEEPIELSNGIVYKVNKIHIPTNVLVYRLKDFFHLYDNCTEAQKGEYFKMVNMAYDKTKVDVEAWTPLAGVWPAVEDRVLVLKNGADGADNPFSLDFTPIKTAANNTVTPYLVPPGSYRLSFGSKQNQNIYINVSILVDGKVVGTSSDAIHLGSTTTYHYDRNPGLYAEGYDPTEVSALSTSSRCSNYDTDGGPLIEEVTIPDVKGDGSAVPIVIRIENKDWNTQTSFTFCHWCLRPTVNNY